MSFVFLRDTNHKHKGYTMNTLSKIILATLSSIALATNLQAHEHHNHVTEANQQANTSCESCSVSKATQSSQILEAMHAPMHAHKPSASKSVEIDFLADMIPHHQGAIDSAKLLLPQTKNPQVALLAENIIKAQEAEINEFKELIAKKGVKTTKVSAQEYKEFSQKNAKANESTMSGMTIEESGDIDLDFLNAMIAHHTGAVESSDIVLSYTKDKKIQEIAKHIIDEQNTQITAMQKLKDDIKATKEEADKSKKPKKK